MLELFAGTRSIGNAFEERGHEVFSIDWNEKFEGISWYENILNITAEDIIERFGKPDVIWASPDCSTFSPAGMWRHRKKNPDTGVMDAVSDYAKECDKVDTHLVELITGLDPKYWFIENPKGGMRTMPWMKDFPRYYITYCQYGDTRQKPTDIWTNHPDPKFKPPCKNGAPCHERSPRSSTVRKMKESNIDVSNLGGVQYGYFNRVKRAEIPAELCRHIVDICEE